MLNVTRLQYKNQGNLTYLRYLKKKTLKKRRFPLLYNVDS